MKKIQFYPEDIYKGPLILVNHNHPMMHDVSFTQMLEIQKGHFLDHSACQILKQLLSEIKMEHQITVVSAWRSMQEQNQIYESSLRENGIDYTQTYVAVAGCSEHQTSYAIDLAKPSKSIDFIAPTLPFDGPYALLRKKMTESGFILRYPLHKQHITKIGFEPWHFRYVGFPHSKIMEEMDLTLEEYHELLKQKTKQNALSYSTSSLDISIYYHPINEASAIDVEEDEIIQYSGNNMDGIIITSWRKKLIIS